MDDEVLEISQKEYGDIEGKISSLEKRMDETKRETDHLKAELIRAEALAPKIEALAKSLDEFKATHTGGEGLWKQVFTCWEHFRLCHKVLPMFQPDTFHSHLKCNLNICL